MFASKKGVDGLESNGHIDDFYRRTYSEGDPYYGNWEPHCQPGGGNCLADFMGTSQWYPDDLHYMDGASSYHTPRSYSSDPLELTFESSTTFGDTPYGVKLFIESKGYNVDFYGSQRTVSEEEYDDESKPSNKRYIRFQDFQEEINNNRPVILHIVLHSMLAIGYNATLNKVFFYNTWDRSIHSMEWEGSYRDLSMQACSFIRLSPNLVPTESITITSNLNLSPGTVGPFDTFKAKTNTSFKLTAKNSKKRIYLYLWRRTLCKCTFYSLGNNRSSQCSG